MENKNKNKQGGKGLKLLVLVFVIFLFGLAEEVDGEAMGIIVSLAILAAVFWLISRAIRAAASKAKGGAARGGTVGRGIRRHEPKVEIHRDFPVPEAHCVVCENTGEDHFDRDRQMRLAQLDDWLKNGLIDRAEYAVLKRKFEQS